MTWRGGNEEGRKCHKTSCAQVCMIVQIHNNKCKEYFADKMAGDMYGNKCQNIGHLGCHAGDRPYAPYRYGMCVIT